MLCALSWCPRGRLAYYVLLVGHIPLKEIITSPNPAPLPPPGHLAAAEALVPHRDARWQGATRRVNEGGHPTEQTWPTSCGLVHTHTHTRAHTHIHTHVLVYRAGREPRRAPTWPRPRPTHAGLAGKALLVHLLICCQAPYGTAVATTTRGRPALSAVPSSTRCCTAHRTTQQHHHQVGRARHRHIISHYTPSRSALMEEEETSIRGLRSPAAPRDGQQNAGTGGLSDNGISTPSRQPSTLTPPPLFPFPVPPRPRREARLPSRLTVLLLV